MASCEKPNRDGVGWWRIAFEKLVLIKGKVFRQTGVDYDFVRRLFRGQIGGAGAHRWRHDCRSALGSARGAEAHRVGITCLVAAARSAVAANTTFTKRTDSDRAVRAARGYGRRYLHDRA